MDTEGRGPRADRFTEKKFEPYVKAVGQSALAWNALHEVLAWTFEFLLFGFVQRIDHNKAAQARAAWNAINSDRDKRKLLRGAAQKATDRELQNHPKLAEDLKWLLDRADEFEDARNTAIHSPFMIFTKRNTFMAQVLNLPDFVTPDVIRDNPRALRLRQGQLLADFRWCRNSILACRDFGSQINRALTSVGYPWPERPLMPARPQKKTQSHRKRQARKE